VRILFYKAWVAGDLKDKAISIWTLGPYSHCELLFPDGVCFSSSWRDDGVGVRYKKFPIIPSHWTCVEIPTTKEQEIQMRQWCDVKVAENAKYDWWGIIQFVIPFVKQKDEDWFCSEICIAALNHAGVLNWTTFMSPNFFYRELKKLPL
jgi:hypothetical protein